MRVRVSRHFSSLRQVLGRLFGPNARIWKHSWSFRLAARVPGNWGPLNHLAKSIVKHHRCTDYNWWWHRYHFPHLKTPKTEKGHGGPVKCALAIVDTATATPEEVDYSLRSAIDAVNATKNSCVVVQTSTLNLKLTDVDIIVPEELGGADSIEFLVVVSAGWQVTPGAIRQLLFACHNAETDLVYCDDDRVDAAGVHHEPRFKPAMSPEMLEAVNYLSGLIAVRLTAFDDVHWCDWLADESYRSESILRRFSGMKSVHRVVHLPWVMAHRVCDVRNEPRTLPNVVAKDLETELVSIIIPTRDGVEILKRCIAGIVQRSTYRNFEILVVDNQSEEPATHEYLRGLQQTGTARVLPYDRDFNFSAINNFAVERAKGDVVVLVNNDIEPISPDWLEQMLKFVERRAVGAVGAKLLYPNGTLQHAGVVLGIGGVAGHSHKYFPGNALGQMGRLQHANNVSAVTGACLMVRKSVYREVGGLDAQNLKIAFNDVDFCLKLREVGYRNVWASNATLYHHESLSRGAEDTPEKKARFASEVHYMLRRWPNALNRDPYYNLNLTLEHEDFGLATPPRWDELSR